MLPEMKCNIQHSYTSNFTERLNESERTAFGHNLSVICILCSSCLEFPSFFHFFNKEYEYEICHLIASLQKPLLIIHSKNFIFIMKSIQFPHNL
jgi:hypothetical protein